MNIFLATEECPGCGVFFEAPAELTKVDFKGKRFKVKDKEENDK